MLSDRPQHRSTSELTAFISIGENDQRVLANLRPATNLAGVPFRTRSRLLSNLRRGHSIHRVVSPPVALATTWLSSVEPVPVASTLLVLE